MKLSHHEGSAKIPIQFFLRFLIGITIWKFSDVLPKAVKSMSSRFSKIFSIEAVNLLKVEESIISGGKKRKFINNYLKYKPENTTVENKSSKITFRC